MTPADVTLLIVDDEPLVRRALTRILPRFGFLAERILEASGVAAAIEVLKRARVTLVLTDLNMARSNGLELVRVIRSTPSLAHLPVVLHTATLDAEQLVAAKRLGVAHIVPKPTGIRELIGSLLLSAAACRATIVRASAPRVLRLEPLRPGPEAVLKG
jgi:two-component system chemotaxis response regulator CheY